MLPEASAACTWMDEASWRSAAVLSETCINGSGVCCESHLMPLLNLPVGLLSWAKLAAVVGSVDLREVRDEMRLPVDGLVSRDSGLVLVSCSAEEVCARVEEELVKGASTPPPEKLEEERRKGLAVMKRGWENEEEEEACWCNALAPGSGLGGCASCVAASACAAMLTCYKGSPVELQLQSMRCDVMRCDAIRCDAIRCDAIRCDTIRYDSIRCGLLLSAMVEQFGMPGCVKR